VSKASLSTRCATFVWWTGLIALIVGGYPSFLEAQRPGGIVPNAPCPPEGCITGVTVTPDGGNLTLAPNTASVAHFVAHNTGNVSTPFTFTCIASGITCGTVTPASFTIAAGGSLEVDVGFTSGTGTGKVTLKATNGGTATDQGFFNVTVVVVGPPSAVAFRNQNGDNIDRSACLTSGAGEAAARTCGDLVVTHALPGYTSMGKTRNLTLIYNSAQAVPQPLVAVAVNETGAATPNFVYGELKVNGVVRAANTYAGWGTAPLTRQITLSYDASTDSTGVYPFTFEVKNIYTTGGSFSSFLSGSLIVVNRAASRYGRGWRPAGIEELRLHQLGNESILWVGGDGSAKLYSPLTTTTWRAAPGGFRDTLVLAGGQYTRRLRHGVQVVFDAQGRHIKTIARTTQTTTIAYNADGQVSTIAVPPGGAANTYTFTYGTTDQMLDAIAEPPGGGRTLTVTITGGQLVTATDPDGRSTTFAYLNAQNRLMSRRTGRRGFGTDFQFLHNLRLTQVTIPIDASGASAVTRFSPWDELGLQNLTPTDTAQVCDSIFGPRTQVADDARITVDRWGAPTKIVNALGAVTKITRGDPNFPLLVTKVIYPKASGTGDGRVVLMTYDQTRGNLTQVRDSTWHLATSIRVPTKSTIYTYCQGVACNTEDSPTRVADSVGTQIRKTDYTYTTLGLTNDVLDARGHRTTYGYTTGATIGLVNKITEKSVETWLDTVPVLADNGSTTLDLITQFTFDAKGNLQTAKAPGLEVTGYQTDGAGRVTDTYTPLGFRQHYDYDPMNRITKVTRFTAKTFSANQPSPMTCRLSFHFCGDSTRAVGAALGTSVAVQYNFGPSDLNSIVDGRGVTRSFIYDARGLMTEEHSGFQGRVVRYTTYDEAGNVVLRINPVDNNQGTLIVDTTGYVYDALNRLQTKGYHEHDYGIVNGIDQLVPGDSIRYTYDQLGAQLTTSNLNGTLVRTYWADGALQTRKATTPLFDSLFYAYDQTGARTTMSHTLSNGSIDQVTFTYAATIGDLQTMSVNWGAPANLTRNVSFLWDALGRRKQVTYPNNTVVTYRYGGDGRIRRILSANPTAVGGQNDRFDFTSRADSVDMEGRPLHQRTTCTGYNPQNPDPDATLGFACGASPLLNQANRYNLFNQLVWQNAGIPDSFAFDASDNMIMQKTGTQLPRWFNVSLNSDRILADSVDGDPTGSVVHFFYDSTGSRFEEGTATSALRFYFYDGMGRTTGIRDTQHNGSNRFNCILYDGDGNALSPCDDFGNRLAYDGASVVGATSIRSWSFVQGPGLDDPILGLYRQTQPSLFKEWYWVTDGQGRQFATGSPDGLLGSIPSTEYKNNGGSYAGGTQNANTFGADRFASPVLPALSFFRNRVYDQNTGRWSQEDPAGVAGGLNLYAFNGNNPVLYSDPFGLAASNCCTMPLLDPSAALVGPIDVELAQFNNRAAASIGGLVASGALLPEGAAARMAEVRAAGAAGEAAAGIAKNTKRISSATGTAAYRVPDGLGNGVLSEVKNVGRLSLTDQLRDFAAYAKDQGLRFDLYVRDVNTKLTSELVEFIGKEGINLRFLK
jgi:RHS repeat-associated protein